MLRGEVGHVGTAIGGQLATTATSQWFDECLERSADVRDPDVYYQWAPLEQMSEKEGAEIFKTTADAASTVGTTSGQEIIPRESRPDEELAAAAAPQAATRPVVKSIADAAPRTLVRRDVLNAAEIVKWAKAQGFTDIVPALHVSITYSRDPLTDEDG